MILLLEAALEIQSFCRRQAWKMCVIGGLAVMRWGRPRSTEDVDVSLLTGFGNEQHYVDSLIASFSSRLQDARQFALQSRVLLLSAANQVPLDVSLAGFPFEEGVIARATEFEFAPNCKIITASAEDLVAMKAFADRPQDWIDVEAIVMRQKKRLDWGQVTQEVAVLSELRDSPEIVDRLQRLRKTIDGA